MKLILKKTTNIDDIKAILCNPAIYDTITNSKTDKFDDFESLVNAGCFFIGGYVKGRIIALACYHGFKDGNKYHPCVIPEYRSKYADSFIEQSLAIKGTRPLYAEIPNKYPHVIKFAKKHGFYLIEDNYQNKDSSMMRFKDEHN